MCHTSYSTHGICCYDRRKQGVGHSVSCTNGLYAHVLGTVKTVISGHKRFKSSGILCHFEWNGKILNNVVKECNVLIFMVKQRKKNI